QTFVSNSVFTGNSASGGNGGDGAVPSGPTWLGGCGPAMGGAAYVGSNGILVNCTFATNSARGGSIGNGFGYINGGNATGGALTGTGFVQAVNLTFQGNTAIGGQGFPSPNGTNGNSYGGSIANSGGGFQIVNSILSGGFSNNCFGTVTDLGHNISSDATPTWTSGTSVNNTDPLLLPLANNGGPTLTMALRAGSPALNTADCALAPATDQRGYARPSGPGCDVGAYEGPGTTSLQIIRQSSSTNVLRWLAEAGQTYRLEITADFTGWTPYATNSAGTNGWLDFPVPANLSPRFFRLLAQ
ncbi:MAG TPA: choice-of-anchor Q domain-containing protein, partial [Verrucomicrobiae bacterium]